MTFVKEEFCALHNYDLEVNSFLSLDLIFPNIFNYTIPKKGNRIQLWTYLFKTIKIHKIIRLLEYLLCHMLIVCSIICIKFKSSGQLEVKL